MDSIYTKNFIILALIMLFASATFMLLMPVLPIFALEVVKLPEGQIGLIVGAFSVTALFARPFIGYLLDNYDKKLIFIISLGLFTLVIISYEFVGTLVLLLAVRMLQGGSWASVSTSASTMVVDIIPPRKRAEGIGIFSLSMPLAMVIGPAAGIQMYTATGSFSFVFGVAAVICAIAFIMSFWLKMPPREDVPRRKLVLSPKTLYETRVLGIAFMQFCYSFAYSGIATFIPVYALKNNIENFSYFFLVYALSILLSRILVRKTFDLRGPSPLIYMGYISFAIGGAIMGFTTSAGLLYLSGFFCGLGGGMVMPTINTMTMNVVEQRARGKATATVMTAIDVGMGVGALVLGFIAQHLSYPSMYFTVTGSLIIPLLWYKFYERRHYMNSIECLTEALNRQE